MLLTSFHWFYLLLMSVVHRRFFINKSVFTCVCWMPIREIEKKKVWSCLYIEQIVENVDSRIHTTTFLKLYWMYCNNEGSRRIDSGYGYQVISLKYRSLTFCLIIVKHKINRKKNVSKFVLTLVWNCRKMKNALPNCMMCDL